MVPPPLIRTPSRDDVRLTSRRPLDRGIGGMLSKSFFAAAKIFHFGPPPVDFHFTLNPRAVKDSLSGCVPKLSNRRGSVRLTLTSHPQPGLGGVG